MKIDVSGCVKIQQCQPVILKMENKNGGGGKERGKKKKKKKKATNPSSKAWIQTNILRLQLSQQ